MAKRVVLGLAVLVVAGAVTIGSTVHATLSARLDVAPISTQQADALLARSTVQLLAFGCNLTNNQGTGVFVAPGRLLTNAHVVVGSRLVDVSADGYPTVVADVPSVARAGDVAVVDAAAIGVAGIPIAPTDPVAGDPVRVAGFPSAPAGVRPPGLVISAATVTGTLAGTDVGQPWPVLRLSVSVQPGMSGGPVLDQQGRLAGIVFGNEVPTGGALAIPASALADIVESGDVVAAGCS